MENLDGALGKWIEDVATVKRQRTLKADKL
jgi:hypothetical protein